MLAQGGNTDAQCFFARLHWEGIGGPKDLTEAVKWLRMAAKQGDAYRQNNLGVMYAKGEGVPEDAAEAVKWFQRAADRGHVRANFCLGNLALGFGPDEWFRAVVSCELPAVVRSAFDAEPRVVSVARLRFYVYLDEQYQRPMQHHAEKLANNVQSQLNAHQQKEVKNLIKKFKEASATPYHHGDWSETTTDTLDALRLFLTGTGDDSTRANQSATDETPREPAQAEVPAVVVDSDCSFPIELVAVLIVLFSAAHTVPFVACFFHS